MTDGLFQGVTLHNYDLGKPAVRYNSITSWNSRLHEITDHLRGMNRIYPNLIKENRMMSTCNQLDLQKLGSQLIISKNLPNHCFIVTFSCSNFYKMHFCKVIGSLTRCKLNMDQEERPCIQKWICVCDQKVDFGDFHVWPSLPSSLLLSS